MITVDQDLVLKGIMDTNVSPAAKEQGAILVEDWIGHNHEFDSQQKTIAVECGFQLWVEDKTLIVGVVDRIAEDDNNIYGCEWKSTAKESKWWNEDKWLEDILAGNQIATYALAIKYGEFLEAGGNGESIHKFKPGVESPRIFVRAASKSSPTVFWPSDRNDGFRTFTQGDLEAVWNSYVNMAREIRALRQTGLYPWQHTGKQCVSFNQQCSLFDQCREHTTPRGTPVAVFDKDDPASKLSLYGVDVDDPELVILSSSAYSTAARCKELYRITSGSYGEKESSLALDIGTAMHGGLSAYYKQMKA